MKRLFSVLSLCSLVLLMPACGWRGRGRCCPQPCAPVYAAPCATPCAAPCAQPAYGAPCVDGSCAVQGEYVEGQPAPITEAGQPAMQTEAKPMQKGAIEAQEADMSDEDLGGDLDLDEDKK